MSKKATYLFKICLWLNALAFSFFGFLSCGNKNPYGTNSLTSKNVEDTVWLRRTFPDFFERGHIIDSSLISIRVSKKAVMKGFINSADSSQGAFAELLHVFSGFSNADHNPNAKFEYFFFDGDNNGQLIRTKSSADYFKTSEYTSVQNNLHSEFAVIANDIKADTNRNKFFVLFSDGETTIREEKNLNTTELNDLKVATKQILQINPNIQIGILSLRADFNGDYNYDLNKSKLINCQRYLYAVCFFDKEFLPEFNRFCELNKKGTNFLFNPQFYYGLYKTKYLTDNIDGQPNKAISDFYAAFPLEMNGRNIEFKYQNIFTLKDIDIPTKVKLEANQYSQIDTFRFGNSKLIQSLFVNPQAEITLNLKDLQSSSITKADFFIDFNQPLDSLVNNALLKQDITNNTIEQIKNISGADILKTEGLKDMLQMIAEALAESKKQSMLSNFIQLGKYK